MGAKQKKKPKSSTKNPDLFEKPMENPFLDSDVRLKVPVRNETSEGLFEKTMENPFTHVKEEPPKEQKVPRKAESATLTMPPKKSWEEVSENWGSTSAIRVYPKKKTG